MTVVLVDEPRIYDEERAWLASMADPDLLPYGMAGSSKDSWLEDANLFVDVTTTYNFRDRRDHEQMEPTIYNELILEPRVPQYLIKERRDYLFGHTKAALMAKAVNFGIGQHLNMRMTKTAMVEKIMDLVPTEG